MLARWTGRKYVAEMWELEKRSGVSLACIVRSVVGKVEGRG